ncbi:unnamed protein product [Protopolystoma xenopodis]|uniref:Uncharacterized protein n=1 Tax=Protopolystoma xenopodis TaxID=117903 RepID=A0A3S5AY74_9PLAT|nr:unnamed protein product [Protopolystoma xenopodis]
MLLPVSPPAEDMAAVAASPVCSGKSRPVKSPEAVPTDDAISSEPASLSPAGEQHLGPISEEEDAKDPPLRCRQFDKPPPESRAAW